MLLSVANPIYTYSVYGLLLYITLIKIFILWRDSGGQGEGRRKGEGLQQQKVSTLNYE